MRWLLNAAIRHFALECPLLKRLTNMTLQMSSILRTAEAGLAALEDERLRAESDASRKVYIQRDTGNGHIDHGFRLQRPFRLVYIRCHFAGSLAAAAFTITLHSGAGTAYDTRLAQVPSIGTSLDLFYRVPEGALREPSPWTFAGTDYVHCLWTNPNPLQTTWGLEVGLALAS
jgi:hypothetical protein